jgi:arylsulfatase
VGGEHTIVESDRQVPVGPTTLGFRMRRSNTGGAMPSGIGTLLVNGQPAGSFETDRIFWLMISWSGLDIGLDRGTTVSDYDGTGRFMGPNEFTGTLVKVVVDLDDDQQVDHEGHAENELARD